MTLEKPAVRRDKTWLADADDRARRIVREHTKELYEEAERVAERCGSDAVAVRYVEQAADIVRVRPASNMRSEVVLALGTALLGLGGGALLAIASAPGADPPPAVLWVSTSLTVVGFAVALVSGTLMWVKRT